MAAQMPCCPRVRRTFSCPSGCTFPPFPFSSFFRDLFKRCPKSLELMILRYVRIGTLAWAGPRSNARSNAKPNTGCLAGASRDCLNRTVDLESKHDPESMLLSGEKRSEVCCCSCTWLPFHKLILDLGNIENCRRDTVPRLAGIKLQLRNVSSSPRMSRQSENITVDYDPRIEIQF